MPANRRTFLAAASLAPFASALSVPARAQTPPALPARPAPPPTGLVIDPREFGARADATTKDTAAARSC